MFSYVHTNRKRCAFSPVCQSFCSRGVGVSVPVCNWSIKGHITKRDPLDRDPPDRDPPGQRTPLGHRCPGQRPPDRDPLDRDPRGLRSPWTQTPWTETPRQRPPPDRNPAMVARALRILLECILVL